MSLADAHVHLSDAAFCGDVDGVMARARDSGISLVVNVTTTKDELDTSFAYAERFPHMRFCHVAGTPPQDAQNVIEDDFRYFRDVAHTGKLSAIGEVGLDYYFADTETARERQKEVLYQYLSLALECALPLVIHCRAAFSDFFSILDQYYHHDSRSCPGMLHCFTGTLDEAKELLARGWFISISGIVTFKNAQGLRDLVAEIPLDHLLIETDAPFLAPTPWRGKKNEPAYITHTMETIAKIYDMSIKDLKGTTYTNTLRFLNKTKN